MATTNNKNDWKSARDVTIEKINKCQTEKQFISAMNHIAKCWIEFLAEDAK